jgi:hypothetical protein
VLGQPLDLPVSLRLEPGDRVTPECVFAEIQAGDTHLGRDHVSVRLEPPATRGGAAGDWVARVVTDVPIVEPVLDITLTVGCERRFSRRFVAFADPPGRSSVTAAAAEATAAAPVAMPFASERSTPSAFAAVTLAGPARRASAAAGPVAAPASVAPARQAKAPATPRADRPSSTSARRRVAESGAPRLLLEAAGPRLRIDLEGDLPPGDGPPLVAKGGASSASAVVSTDTARLNALQAALAELRREAQAEREATVALKMRLAESEARSRAVPWLASLLLLTLGVAAWLTLRLRRQKQAGAGHWWTDDEAVSTDHRPEESDEQIGIGAAVGDGTLAAPPVAVAPAPPAAVEPPLVSMPSPVVAPAVAKEPAEPVSERTTAIPGPPPFALLDAGVDAMVREVSVEELLDLEQQADFFIALGQEDAAVDLLISHVRSTGGLSPLPYIKLLEIYRRQDNREAYERIRTRFNRRFNAYAPDWDAGPLSGRALEAYNEVSRHLQAVWSRPIDAMALLEAMLFRKDESHELFDLPAYQDVLLLYVVARDLWQQDGNQAAPIDVLLPLAESSAVAVAPGFGSTQSTNDGSDPEAVTVVPPSGDGPGPGGGGH